MPNTLNLTREVHLVVLRGEPIAYAHDPVVAREYTLKIRNELGAHEDWGTVFTSRCLVHHQDIGQPLPVTDSLWVVAGGDSFHGAHRDRTAASALADRLQGQLYHSNIRCVRVPPV